MPGTMDPTFALRTNSRMAAALRRSRAIPRPAPLPASLERILRAGWTRGESNALLLRSFARRSPGATISRLSDVIGLEAYVNHLHVDDYVDPATTRDEMLRYALAYAARGLESAWRNHRVVCTAVVSAGDRATGVVVRFHSARSGGSWLADDLEGYLSEGVASIDLAQRGSPPDVTREPRTG